MNTTLTTHPLTAAQPIFQRFLWKEYRMLRGFWLAVGVLGVLVQFVLSHLQFDARQVPVQLFSVAWGAAALYAVGAAITLFSAERDERTHDFLRVLPDRWLPMFVGKVLLAILSAVALAVVLSLTGWFLANGTWPAETARRETLAVVGVAIVEATVWGLLFSLWMKQPLLAAIVSMAAASLGAQLAVVANTPNDAAAYSQAVTARLLVCFGVFSIDIWLASRWLHPTSNTRFLKRRNAADSLVTQEEAAAATVETRPRRRRILASLLWQTWRESWKTMLAAVPIALLLMIAISATSWFSKSEILTVFLCPLLLPALFGALVFRADQRHGHRQFLVAHAGRPHYVWFARHVVWLTSLIALGCVLYLIVIWLTEIDLQEKMRHQFHNLQMYGHNPTAWSLASDLQMKVSTFWDFLNVGWCALLAAYGLGQLCSMLLKREVLAGFMAMLLAAVLTAWAIMVGVWELSPSWYVLSIGVATMVATWLRTPDWIVDRNSPRAWLAPALAIVLPLGLIFLMLPQARLDQIALAPTSQLYNYLHEPLDISLRDYEAAQADARATATAYERLYATLIPMEEASKDIRIEGMSYDELLETIYNESDFEGSRKEFRFEIYGDIPGRRRRRYANTVEGWGEITPNNQKLLKRFGIAKGLAYTKANQGMIAELETLSRRPHAEITFSDDVGISLWSTLSQIEHLLLEDATQLIAKNQLETAGKRYLCALRMRGQILSRRSTLEFAIASRRFDLSSGSYTIIFYDLDFAILHWAQHPAQTSKTLKAAIHDLQEVYANYPELRESVLTDHLSIRDVLLEKEPASFFSDRKKTWVSYLPFMANKISWERERALRSLDILTKLCLNSIDKVTFLLEGGEDRRDTNRKRFRFADLLQFPNPESVQIVNESVYDNDWDTYSAAQKLHHLCNTSYLMAEEMSHRIANSKFMVTAINNEVARRGLLLQLALLAYQLDHEEYPDRLEELSPDYLTKVPLDPYSQMPFEYRAEGLNLPLSTPALDPNTPLLWSVGIMQLTMGKQPANMNAWNSPSGEGYGYGGEYGGYIENYEEIGEENSVKLPEPEMAYVIRSSNSRWGDLNNLIFPLPAQKESNNSN